jgi:succinoglycan biosynthesis protein ExoM
VNDVVAAFPASSSRSHAASMTNSDVAPLDLVVGVATFRRPSGLADLLQSFAHVHLPDDARCSLIVVDNDEDQTARDVCDRFRAALPFSLTYDHEPRRGISFARNRVLARAVASGADVVAFVDDDQDVSPCWLRSLVAQFRASGADVVSGPVEPRFPPDVPKWVLDGKFFRPPTHPNGAELELAFTGNVLFDLQLVTQHGLWFNPRFAMTGGEDVDFFTRARACGVRIVWAADAIAYETVGHERLRSGWLALRLFRSASCTVISEATIYPRHRVIHRWLPQCFVRVVRAVCCLLASARLGRSSLTYAIGHLAVAAGILAGMFGLTYPEYARGRP